MLRPILRSQTVSVSIERPPADVYQFVADPQTLPQWATAFARSVKKSGGAWIVETSDGPMTIRFALRNDLGVLDHYVSPAPGEEIYNPMRVIANGSGSEVLFTVFQLSSMSDAKYAEDLGLVQKDLRILKAVLER